MEADVAEVLGLGLVGCGGSPMIGRPGPQTILNRIAVPNRPMRLVFIASYSPSPYVCHRKLSVRLRSEHTVEELQFVDMECRAGLQLMQPIMSPAIAGSTHLRLREVLSTISNTRYQVFCRRTVRAFRNIANNSFRIPVSLRPNICWFLLREPPTRNRRNLLENRSNQRGISLPFAKSRYNLGWFVAIWQTKLKPRL